MHVTCCRALFLYGQRAAVLAAIRRERHVVHANRRIATSLTLIDNITQNYSLSFPSAAASTVL